MSTPGNSHVLYVYFDQTYLVMQGFSFRLVILIVTGGLLFLASVFSRQERINDIHDKQYEANDR